MALDTKDGRFRFLTGHRFRNMLRHITVIAVVGLFAAVLYWVINNTVSHLRTSGTVSGFGFLFARSGINFPNTLIPYSADSTNLMGFLNGIVNTIFMAIICIIAATIIGVLVGIGRLSGNWLLRNVAMGYVELFRNLPPLLVILFWYFGVLQLLPAVRQSLALGGGIFLNKKGIFFPMPQWGDWAFLTPIVFIVGLVLCFLLHLHRKRTQANTGRQIKTLRYYFLFLVVLPLVTFLLIGKPIGYNLPVLGAFNFSGGGTIPPEGIALFMALSLYTGALIGETVRSGFISIDRGYIEAASSLGLKRRLIIRLIMMPLALRVIIPPLSSQYMNLMKNTSLGVAIGYSELMQVGNDILNRTNRSIEVVLIWIVVYLGLSLLISFLMNWFNRKMALKER